MPGRAREDGGLRSEGREMGRGWREEGARRRGNCKASRKREAVRCKPALREVSLESGPEALISPSAGAAPEVPVAGPVPVPVPGRSNCDNRYTLDVRDCRPLLLRGRGRGVLVLCSCLRSPSSPSSSSAGTGEMAECLRVWRKMDRRRPPPPPPLPPPRTSCCLSSAAAAVGCDDAWPILPGCR